MKPELLLCCTALGAGFGADSPQLVICRVSRVCLASQVTGGVDVI